MVEALYDGECSLVLMVLHHEPRDCLPIFAVDIAGFEELVVQFSDRLGRVVGVKVNHDSIDHIGFQVYRQRCVVVVVVMGGIVGKRGFGAGFSYLTSVCKKLADCLALFPPPH